jgi:hypothetical protein
MWGAASVISGGVGLLVMIAFVVVIATSVRRHRPDVTPILLGAIGFECVIALASNLTPLVLARFTSVSGPSGGSYMEAYALSTLIFSIARAAARACLLWGIVRLAEPPNH